MFDSPFLTPQHPLRASQEVCGSLKSIGYSCIDSIVVLTAFNFNILIYIYNFRNPSFVVAVFCVSLSLSLFVSLKLTCFERSSSAAEVEW